MSFAAEPDCIFRLTDLETPNEQVGFQMVPSHLTLMTRWRSVNWLGQAIRRDVASIASRELRAT